MEPEGSLPHSQVPATCPYPAPVPSTPYPQVPLTEDLNITLPSTPGSPQWSLSLRFPHQKPVHASPLTHTHHMPHPSHSFLFLFTRKTLGEKYISLSSSLCSFLHSPVTSFLSGPNILNTLFSNTLSLRSSLNVSDQVSMVKYSLTSTHKYVWLHGT